MNVTTLSSDPHLRPGNEDALNILRAAVRQSTEAILVTTAELDAPGPEILFVNQAFAEMSGYTADELIGQTPRILQGPKTDRATLDRLRRALSTGEAFAGESINYRRDGSEYVVEWKISPVRDDHERVTHFVSVQRDVTERQRAAEALSQSEERYRSVVAAMAEGLVLQDEAGAIIHCNPAAERILGLSFDQMAGRTSVDSRWRAVREDGSPFPGEEHPSMVTLRTGAPCAGVVMGVHRPDGRLNWLSINSQPLWRSGQERPSAVVSSFTDITERKRAEAALRESAERLRAQYDGLPVPTYTWRFDGEDFYLAEYNRAAGLLTGERAATLLGRSAGEVFRERPDILADFARCYDERRTLRREISYRMASTGEDKELSVSYVYAPPDTVVAHIEDITERKAQESALRAGERRLRTLLESLPQMIFLKDRNYRFLCANAAFAAMFGLTSEEVIGRTDEDLFPHELADKFRADDERVIRAGRPETFEEMTLIRGRQRVVEVTKAPVIDGGEVMGVVGISTDVTERREIEEHLRQSQRIEAVGRLAGGIAHDFNNLLTVIAGYGALTLSRLPDDHPVRNHVEEIKKAADRAALLTKQLLAYSRRQILHPEVLDLNAVVADMEKMLQRLIGERVNFTTRLQPGLARVRADRGQLEQVIMNLAVNARDAILTDGQLSISTGEEVIRGGQNARRAEMPPGRYAVLSVSDSGCGIEKELMEKIFEPFFTTKEVGKGTGLGLSTVYGIVKQSGGHIFVHSEVGRGTTFQIYLPVIEGWAETGEATAAAGELERGRETILLVEDEEIVRSLTQQVLEMCGYRVYAARHGVEALDLARRLRDKLDLLLTDVVMPEMGGRELAERLAALKPSLRVLFMTGYTDDAIFHHGGLEAEVNLIEKPFTPDALAARVREVLDAPGPTISISSVQRAE